LDSFDDLNAVIERAKLNNVSKIVTIGTQINDYARLRAICEQYADRCYMTIGVHPDNVSTLDERTLEETFAHITDDRVIGIGEIGLDYREHPDIDVKTCQQKAFESQLSIAQTHRKPVYIHTRNAIADTIEIASRFPDVRGVFHCFCEGLDIARKVLDLGYCISLSGIVTFRNAPLVHDIARFVPLDRLLVETDAPYLAPSPHRGKRNEPAYVRLVAEGIANLRGVPSDVICEQTTANFYELFPLAQNYSQ
jgi:TatD DNase family protein